MTGVRPKIFMGIDPGFADLGYGIIAVSDGKERCIAYGSIQTRAGLPAETRLLDARRELLEVLERFRPDKIGIERLYFSKNVKTAIGVAEARGVIRMTIAEQGIPCAEFNPADVKNAVCGHGAAPKAQVQRMVATLLGLDDIPKPDDAADALALALALASTEKFSSSVTRERRQ